MSTRLPWQGLSIRSVLLLGFGLTFGIWAFTGYHFTRRIADVEQRATAINERYMRAQELLSTVRAQVLLGSVFVRDALLDPDPATAPEYRRQLEHTYSVIEDALKRYVPILDSAAERERVFSLGREIGDYRTTMLDVLGTGGAHSPAVARMLLRTKVVPKRQTVMELSEDVQSLNRVGFVQQQAEVAAVYSGSQRRIWQTLSLALAASFAIALLATMHAGRLEDRVAQQRAKEVQNTRDLEELSAKLITAQEEERRSIARELHDEVGQVLTAIKVELAVAQRSIDAVGGQADVLSDARAVTDGALHTVRDLSHLLHPALLDDLGLPDAVAWYLRGFGRRHGVKVDLLHERMDQRLTPESEASAYRIIQEALTNVAKHARATTCRVFLQRLPNTVLMTIEDDGVGFDPEAVKERGAPRGLGLIGIRERVSQLQGTLRVESAPYKGTRLTIEFPARARAVAADGLVHA